MDGKHAFSEQNSGGSKSLAKGGGGGGGFVFLALSVLFPSVVSLLMLFFF